MLKAIICIKMFIVTLFVITKMFISRRVIKKYSGRLIIQPFTQKEVQPFVGKFILYKA